MWEKRFQVIKNGFHIQGGNAQGILLMWKLDVVFWLTVHVLSYCRVLETTVLRGKQNRLILYLGRKFTLFQKWNNTYLYQQKIMLHNLMLVVTLMKKKYMTIKDVVYLLCDWLLYFKGFISTSIVRKFENYGEITFFSEVLNTLK